MPSIIRKKCEFAMHDNMTTAKAVENITIKNMQILAVVTFCILIYYKHFPQNKPQTG